MDCCLAFISCAVLIRRNREVQDELYERKGIRIPMTRVIMTSDETDETWWDEVAALGWVAMDHEKQKTVERYGRWCVPPFCCARHTVRCCSRGVVQVPPHSGCGDPCHGTPGFDR